MSSKLLTLIIMTAFLSLALVSAADLTEADLISVSSIADLSKTNYEGTFTITLTSNVTGADTVSVTIASTDPIEDKDGNKLNFDLDKTTASLNTTDDEVIVTYTIAPDIDFDYENYDYTSLGDILLSTLTIEAINDVSTSTITDDTIDTQTLPIKFYNSYSIGGIVNDNELKIKVDVENKAGLGEEDYEWYPLDEIQIEVEVENKHDETIDDIIIEWCLYGYDEKECILEEEEDDFKLKKGKEKTVIINFQLDPNDLEDSEEYDFFIKVYSDDSSEYGEEKLSFEYSFNKDESNLLSIMIEDDFVILDNLMVSDSPILCEEVMEITAKVWNIGSDDQEDVFVRIYNKNLGINEQIQMGDIDALESKPLPYSFVIPKGTPEGNYDLEIGVYDDDSEIFENSDDKKSKRILRISVENCAIETESATIAAQLDSETPEAIAGKQVIIQATITNTGDLDSIYSISLTDNSAWSSLVAIDPQTINLVAGDSKEVTIYLDLDNDAQGDKEFTIKATSANGIVIEQDIAFTVEEGVTQDAILNHLQENWFIYTIVLVNLILIIAIIAVIKRMTARPAAVM